MMQIMLTEIVENMFLNYINLINKWLKMRLFVLVILLFLAQLTLQQDKST